MIFYFMKFTQKKTQKFMNINFLKHLKINFHYLMEHFKLLEYKLLWSFQAPYTAHKIFIQGVILKFIMFSLKPTEKH